VQKYAAIYTSKKLHGTAQEIISGGRIFIFHMATQSNTKPVTHEMNALLRALNLVHSKARMLAKIKAHRTQTTPFNGVVGKARPFSWKPLIHSFLITSSFRTNSEILIQIPEARTARKYFFMLNLKPSV
jgi:hypothetical protein